MKHQLKTVAWKILLLFMTILLSSCTTVHENRETEIASDFDLNQPLIAAYLREHSEWLRGFQQLSNGDILIAEVQDGATSELTAHGTTYTERVVIAFLVLSQKEDHLIITDACSSSNELEVFSAFEYARIRKNCNYMFYPQENPTELLLIIQPYNPFPESYRVPLDYKNCADYGKEPKDTLDSVPIYVQDDDWQFGYPVWYFAVPLSQITEDYHMDFGPDTLNGTKILDTVPRPEQQKPSQELTKVFTAGSLNIELTDGFFETEQAGFDVIFQADDCTVAVSHVDDSASEELESVSEVVYAQKTADGVTYQNKTIERIDGHWVLQFERYGRQRFYCYFYHGGYAWYTVMFICQISDAEILEPQFQQWANSVSFS